MKIKINKWNMFDRNGELMWTIDSSKLNVLEKELMICISEQIYGDKK